MDLEPTFDLVQDPFASFWLPGNVGGNRWLLTGYPSLRQLWHRCRTVELLCGGPIFRCNSQHLLTMAIAQPL